MPEPPGPKGFADMLAEYDAEPRRGTRSPRVGEEVSGKVVAVSKEAVFVDLGGKAEGILERTELDEGTEISVGDILRAHVAAARDGQIVLRRRLGRGDDGSLALEHARDGGIPVVGKVSGVNKGGVEVEVAGTRCFCPVSQLELGYVEDPAAFLGRELEFLVTRVEREQGRVNVVLSRRALLQRARAERAADVRARLEVGATVSGTITRVESFGAFVDLGGIEGLIHVSELGFGRVGHPSELLTVGEAVEAQVTKIEPSHDPKKPDRIGLSLKALKTDPFPAATAQFAGGAVRKGKVVRLESFGAFVDLGEGTEGLIHVSELLADRRVHHPREVLSVGQEVEVAVLGVDQERRRIALSMKQADARREADQAAGFQPASGHSLGTFADIMKKKLGK